MPTETFEPQRLYESLGLQLVPLHGVMNGACRCKDGPTCKQPGKHPRVMWKDKPSKLPGPNDNWGVATDPLIVLDFDTVRAFDELAGQLPETFMVKSAKGVHAWYLADPERPKRCQVGWRPSVDVRARGGLIVVPPSRTATGGVYEAIGDHCVVANAPEWLMESLPDWKRYERGFHGTGVVSDTTSPHFRPIVDRLLTTLSTAQSGERNLTLFKVSSRLFDLYAAGYVGADVRDELLLTAWGIGLGADEIERTVGSGWPVQ